MEGIYFDVSQTGRSVRAIQLKCTSKWTCVEYVVVLKSTEKIISNGSAFAINRDSLSSIQCKDLEKFLKIIPVTRTFFPVLVVI